MTSKLNCKVKLSTLESGLAKNEVVEVKAGDIVYDVDGEGRSIGSRY
jgi:hypothetical protein